VPAGPAPPANQNTLSRTKMPPKWPHFSEFAPTTALQPEGSLSANSANMPIS